MCPTTVPGDDYEHYSALIENLSTRTDLSYRVWGITDLRLTIQRLKQRDIDWDANWHAEEPFSLEDRIEELQRHWRSLELAQDKPEVWDAQSDNTFLPPLSEIRYNYTSTGPHVLESESDDPNALYLSAEQDRIADYHYKQWRADHDHKSYFLRREPPVPIEWKSAWEHKLDKLYTIDLPLLRSRSVKVDKMKQFVPDRGSVKTGAWKPTHEDMFDWDISGYLLKPGETQEMRDKEMDMRKRYMKEEKERRQAREKKQRAFIRKTMNEAIAEARAHQTQRKEL